MVGDKPNKTFIVLSMHRSASSLVAKSLHEAGVHMGDKLLSGHADNPEGHFEDLDFLRTNISMMGGDNWRNPDTKVYDIDVSPLVKAKDIKPLWGFKDPRTALTIDKYYDYFEDPIIVALFRNPEMVGKSLEARGDMTKEEGIKLAKQYNRKILDFLNKKFGGEE